MEIGPYVDTLHQELAVAAAAGGEAASELAERLLGPLESATRLVLLEALAAAAAEITRELAPGSVEVRLRGREPSFAVTLAARDEPAEPVAAPVAVPSLAELDDGATSRINLRLPDTLKARVEEAAAAERLSVNAWLVRAAAAALGNAGRPATVTEPTQSGGGRYSGWVR